MRVEDFTDEQDALGLAIQDYLDARPGRLFSPSVIARAVRSDTWTVRQVADAIEAARFINGSGNGCWHKYISRHRI